MLLERYALGQVTGEERKQVEQALQADEVTRERFAEIRGAPAVTNVPRPGPALHPARWLAPALAAGLVAAVSAFLVRTHLSSDPIPSGAKGDALVLSVVSEHGSEVSKLVPGERYSLQVTCVPPREATVSVSVTQDGKREKPFGDEQRVLCANDVPVGGAIVFDSASPAEVCIEETERRHKSCIHLH